MRIEEAIQLRNFMYMSSVNVQRVVSEYAEPCCGQEEDRNDKWHFNKRVLVTFRFLSTST